MNLEIAFWIIAGLLVHTYITFPISLPLLSEFFSRKKDHPPLQELPKVSVIISAYNEEAVIAEKIRNCLELDYPADKLEILIGNDGSSDRTAEIVAQFPQVRLVNAPKNAGKAAMLNHLQPLATGDILLFCDANTLFFPNVALKIVQPFQDPKIGCVCGHLILNDSSQSALGEGESAYWDLESEIKKFEGLLDRVIGGNGAIYAIRRELYSPIPTRKSIMDDFYVTVRVLQKGFLSTFVSSAIGTEQTSKAGSGEFKRKIRIGRANYNFLFSYLLLLNPLRPLVAYLFFSHKLLRWFSPHLIVTLLVLNILLIGQSLAYSITLVGLLLLLVLGIAGALLAKKNRKTPFTSAPYYLLGMNVALMRGFFLSFLPEKSGSWERVERGGESRVPILPLLALLLTWQSPHSWAKIPSFALDATLGVLNPSDEFPNTHMDFSAHLWYPFDQMVFLGVGSGIQQIGSSKQIPILGSLMVRLPIGGQILPFASGDIGHSVNEDPQFIWRGGAGLDIKNGDYSSLIVAVGYQSFADFGGHYYVRGGLLLEF